MVEDEDAYREPMPVDPNAVHLSECPVSMGWPELGCMCLDDRPDWTL